MIANVNLEEVKKFNSALRQYKDRSVHLNAEIEIMSKEVDSLCAELSTELGVTVTRDNVESICAEVAEKINSSLQSGNVVLSKIAEVEQGVQQTAQVTSHEQELVMPTPVAPVAPAAPVMDNSAVGMGITGGIDPSIQFPDITQPQASATNQNLNQPMAASGLQTMFTVGRT